MVVEQMIKKNSGHKKSYIPELIAFDKLNVVNENSKNTKKDKRVKRLQLLKAFYELRLTNNTLYCYSDYLTVKNLK